MAPSRKSLKQRLESVRLSCDASTHGLSARKWMMCVYAVTLIAIVSSGQAQTLQTTFPVTNGTVNTMVQSGNNIFLGGTFTYAGPNTGRGVAIDPSTGTYVTGFPDVNGKINIVVSDSAGGWYIGGKFTQVGGLARSCLAHIKSDKTVDVWNPNINDAGVDNSQEVFTITKSGSLIYVGGIFTQVGSTLRRNLAAIDSATGLANSWNPGPNNSVFSIVVTPQYTFVGGSFSSFGGATDTTNPLNNGSGLAANSRPCIAEIFTGKNILTQWVQAVGGGVTNSTDQFGHTLLMAVYTMQLHNGSLFVGGNFSVSAGGSNICSLDTVNAYQGNNHLSTFHPNTFIARYSVIRPIFAMAISGDTVFVGGEFGTLGSVLTYRYHIAAALISTNAVISWNPNIPYNVSSTNELSYPYYVSSITVANGVVYISGKFSTLATSGVTRNNIAAINQSGTGTATSWDPNASDAVTSIALQGSSLYAGGVFTSLNGQTRNNLCEINALSGTVTSWNPNANANVQTLALSGTTVFAGGSFTTIGGQSRQYLAGIDTASGLPTAWQASANNSVSSLLVNGGKLYVGGYFTQIGGIGAGDSTRNRIASIDTAATAGVSLWNPNADQGVTVITVSGSTIYVAGGFLNIGSQSRYGVAALDAASGLATSWNPNVNSGGGVKTMAVSGSTMYVGGTFTNVGGAARNNIAAISIADTGIATAWNPNITAIGTLEVDAIAVNGSTIYAGGYFDHVGATSENKIAAIDASTGNATAWACSADIYVYALLLDRVNHLVYLGGSFTNALDHTASSFAAVTNPGDAALPVEMVSLTGTVLNQSNVELHWKTATETDNYGFDIERRMLGGNNATAWTEVGFVHGAGTSTAPHDYAFSDCQLPAGRYGYRIRQIDNAGSSKYTQTVEVEVGSVPLRFTLSQNYPNPFNPTTMLSFTLPNDGRAVLKVFNVIGQEVATLFDQDAAGGKVFQAQFDATKLPSGIYFSRLEFSGKELVRKLLLVK